MPRTYGTSNFSPYSSAPPVGPNGDSYWNTTEKKMYVSDGTSWLTTSPVDEVWVGPDPPTDPLTEMWYDNDAVPPAPSTPTTAPEVFVGPNDPGTTFQLWYDTDAPGLVNGSAVGLEASKPTSAPTGARYFATDTKRDWVWDGTGWIIMYEPQQTYAPTTFNISFGSGGLVIATYQRSAGWCHINLYNAMGTTSAGVITAAGPAWSTPAGISALDYGGIGVSFTVPGSAMLYDASGAIQNLVPMMQNINKMEPRYLAVGGTIAAAMGQVSNTVPITIATGDHFQLKYYFQMSSPYS